MKQVGSPTLSARERASFPHFHHVLFTPKYSTFTEKAQVNTEQEQSWATGLRDKSNGGNKGGGSSNDNSNNNNNISSSSRSKSSRNSSRKNNNRSNSSNSSRARAGMATTATTAAGATASTTTLSAVQRPSALIRKKGPMGDPTAVSAGQRRRRICGSLALLFRCQVEKGMKHMGTDEEKKPGRK